MPRLSEDLTAGLLVDDIAIMTIEVHFQFDLTDPYALELFLVQVERGVFRQQILALELFTDALEHPDTPQGGGTIKVTYIEADGIISIELPNNEQEPFTLQCEARPIYQFLVCVDQLTVVNNLKKQYRKQVSRALKDSE